MNPVRLTFVSDPAERAAALALFAARVEPFNTGDKSIADRCRDADIFCIDEAGRIVGYYAIEARKDAAGHIEGLILAAASVPRVPALGMMRRTWCLIERQFIGAHSVALVTKRRAMVREAKRQGYRVSEQLSAGVVMRKALGAGNALRPL